MDPPNRHIPVEERLPTDVAAPCLAHLLLSSSENSNDSNDGVAHGRPPDSRKSDADRRDKKRTVTGPLQLARSSSKDVVDGGNKGKGGRRHGNDESRDEMRNSEDYETSW